MKIIVQCACSNKKNYTDILVILDYRVGEETADHHLHAELHVILQLYTIDYVVSIDQPQLSKNRRVFSLLFCITQKQLFQSKICTSAGNSL